MADHEIVVQNTVGPFVCAVCNGYLCLDGWPERIDGEWMHVADWQAKNKAKKTLIEELEEVLDDRRLWHFPNPTGEDKTIAVGVIRHIINKHKNAT
jgi:hypothetical protein